MKRKKHILSAVTPAVSPTLPAMHSKPKLYEKFKSANREQALYLATCFDRVGFGVSAALGGRYLFKTIDEAANFKNCFLLALTVIILTGFCT